MEAAHIEDHLNRKGRHFEFHDKVTYIEKQEITVQSGATFFNGPSAEEKCEKESQKHKRAADYTDDDILMLIDDLMDATTDGGDYLMTERSQWFAVYRVMNEKLNYPKRMTDFCRRIEMLCRAEERVPCVYASIKKASTESVGLTVSVDIWDDYDKISERYHKQCIVADYLLRMTGFRR